MYWLRCKQTLGVELRHEVGEFILCQGLGSSLCISALLTPGAPSHTWSPPWWQDSAAQAPHWPLSDSNGSARLASLALIGLDWGV